MEEKKVLKNLSSSSMRKVIPFIILLFLIVILITTSILSGRAPYIKSINPKVCIPGNELIIRGKYFGKERNGGKVNFSGMSPATWVYREWSDDTIRMIIPDNIGSSLLTVVTRYGESKEIIPFVNKKEIPVPVLGPMKPGEAYISSIKPAKGPVGALITIRGVNFLGDSKNTGSGNVENDVESDNPSVYFAWFSGDMEQNQKDDMFASSIPVPLSDYCYESKDDSQIMVRVPDGASSGNVFILNNKGVSNSVFFEVDEPVGQKRIANKRVYQVYYWVKSKVIQTEPENSLRLWIPGIPETPHQQDVSLISSEPGPPEETIKGIHRFTFKNLVPGESVQVKLRYIFKRYEVAARIDPQKVHDFYNLNALLYKVYTQPGPSIPSADVLVITLVRDLIGKERNPYVNALSIYNYLLNKLTPVDASQFDHSDILSLMESKKPEGDAYCYALLFCTLARCAGIPARPVSGYLVSSDLSSYEHYWAEFYIEDFGWVPVDPYLGDGKKYEKLRMPGNPKAYYFGNLDNSRITFSRGNIDLDDAVSEGKIVRERRCASFQSVFEESSASLTSYNSTWSFIGIIGYY
jgi:hypothetical protein